MLDVSGILKFCFKDALCAKAFDRFNLPTE
jgi:hypothetical protein